jgi:hypothetical protein
MQTPTTDSEVRDSASLEKGTNLGNPQDTPKHFPESEFGPAPDGGLRAWLVASGAFCIFFGCLGFTSCFGVLQEYYSTHQLHDRTTDEIAWIGSLSSFIQFSGGALGGPLFDRFGVWVRSSRQEMILYTDRPSDVKTGDPALRLRLDDGQPVL